MHAKNKHRLSAEFQIYETHYLKEVVILTTVFYWHYLSILWHISWNCDNLPVSQNNPSRHFFRSRLDAAMIYMHKIIQLGDLSP